MVGLKRCCLWPKMFIENHRERERERGQTYRTKDQTLENPKRKTLTFSCGWRQMKMNKQTIEKERAR